MQQAETANITVDPSSQSTALYDASCEMGQLIDLLDTMVESLEEERVDCAAHLRRMANLGRIARAVAAGTLATLLAAEGEDA